MFGNLHIRDAEVQNALPLGRGEIVLSAIARTLSMIASMLGGFPYLHSSRSRN